MARSDSASSDGQPAEKTQFDPGPAPDGGVKAWTQAVMGVLCAFNTWGWLTSFGTFQTYYQSDLLAGESPQKISWIGSTQLCLIFFVGVFSGRLFDAGYFRIVYVSGCVLLVLGVFMTSLCKNFWQVFLAQALCSGIGSGLMFTPAMGLVATYFSTKKVFAMAFLLTGAGMGGMVFPAIVSQLIGKIGFPWTIRIVGFVMLGLSALTIALFRTRLPPRRTGPWIEWTAFKEPTFMLYVAGMWFCFFALYFSFFYVGAFGRNIIGISYEESVNLVITINGVGIIGRLAGAYVALWTGPINAVVPCILLSAVLMYCWIAISSVGGLYAFAVIYGITSSAAQGLWPGGLSSLITDVSKTGTRIGMGFTIASTALLTGAPVGGALITRDSGGYLYAQAWAGSSLVLSACILVLARLSKTGPALLRTA